MGGFLRNEVNVVITIVWDGTFSMTQIKIPMSEGGFSGIVAIGWVVVFLISMQYRYKDGKTFADITEL
jgi:hypothetical protein